LLGVSPMYDDDANEDDGERLIGASNNEHATNFSLDPEENGREAIPCQLSPSIRQSFRYLQLAVRTSKQLR